MPSKISRRELNNALLWTAVSALSPAGNARTSRIADRPPDPAFEYGNPLQEFCYGDVTLGTCLQQVQFEQVHAILMGLDDDSLLRPLRMAAELPAPGRDLGGWYSAPSYSPATFGQWLSALSRYFAVTNDEATIEKIKRLLAGYAECIDPVGTLYKLASESSYVYDKFVCGLVDAFRFAHVSEALDALGRSTDAAVKYLPGSVVDELARKDEAGESYTIPENQFIAWQCGAGARHLEIGRSYLYNSFFNSLANGVNDLPGRHAYSHVNSLCSAAKAYLALGDEMYLEAAINGFRFVEQQSWVTGGWGAAGEAFLPVPAYKSADGAVDTPALKTLGDALEHANTHFETPCGAYAHFKLTRYLLRITKDPHYGDSMERVMYNTVLGALPLNKFGAAFYQSNYHAHAQKTYFDGYGHTIEAEWPCCSGTLPQVAADYHVSTYFRDHEGVFVNLYIPSIAQWVQHGVKVRLTQSGAYPLADDVTFELIVPHPTRFSVRLRIPAWTQSPTIQVNEKEIPQRVVPGTFALIRREWRSGDRISLRLPRRLELEPVDALHPDSVALVCGPLVLFAVANDSPKVSRADLLAAKQQSSNPAEWRAITANGTLSMRPFWAIKDEMYFAYLSV